MKQYPEGAATINKSLCYCENCKKYFSEPRIEFCIPKDGYHFEFYERYPDWIPEHIICKHYQVLEKEAITCPDCDNVATVMERTSKIPCPVCGEMRPGRNIGNWD